MTIAGKIRVLLVAAVAAVWAILIIEDPSSEKTSAKDPEGEPETLSNRLALLHESQRREVLNRLGGQVLLINGQVF